MTSFSLWIGESQAASLLWALWEGPLWWHLSTDTRSQGRAPSISRMGGFPWESCSTMEKGSRRKRSPNFNPLSHCKWLSFIKNTSHPGTDAEGKKYHDSETGVGHLHTSHFNMATLMAQFWGSHCDGGMKLRGNLILNLEKYLSEQCWISNYNWYLLIYLFLPFPLNTMTIPGLITIASLSAQNGTSQIIYWKTNDYKDCYDDFYSCYHYYSLLWPMLIHSRYLKLVERMNCYHHYYHMAI